MLLQLSAVIMAFYLIQWVIIGWTEELMVAFDFPKGSIGIGELTVPVNSAHARIRGK